MKKYLKYEISSTPFIPDILSGLLWQLNITGINEHEDSLSVFVTEDSGVNEMLLKKHLDNIISQKIIKSYWIDFEEFEDKNWNENWEMSREVIGVSDRIVIKPTFKDYKQNENEIVLTIDPKMSFGTGEHESTKLVLQLIESNINGGENVLDVGSGTGILSIAAIKLGADYAVAVDNDHQCQENCAENCLLNNVSEQIKIIEGTIDDVYKDEFDLVVANIQKNILIDIAEKIKSKIKIGGKVILSGLLLKDETEIEEKYMSLGFHKMEAKYLNEWLAIVFEKR